MRLTVIRGDITRQHVDAIVNAANEALLGGGGVDGAIHDAAGPQLLHACRALPQVQPGIRCPVGEARITPGFELPASHVIHTVGPRFGAPHHATSLASAFRQSLMLAEEHGLQTVALPAISCGAFAYPTAQAAVIAGAVTSEKQWGLGEVRFVLFSEDLYAIFREALQG